MICYPSLESAFILAPFTAIGTCNCGHLASSLKGTLAIAPFEENKYLLEVSLKGNPRRALQGILCSPITRTFEEGPHHHSEPKPHPFPITTNHTTLIQIDKIPIPTDPHTHRDSLTQVLNRENTEPSAEWGFYYVHAKNPAFDSSLNSPPFDPHHGWHIRQVLDKNRIICCYWPIGTLDLARTLTLTPIRNATD